MHMWKAQHGDVHSTTIFTNKYNQRGTRHLTTCMAVWKMARSMFAPCPYFRDLQGRELKGLLVIIPKVVISLLMVSRGIIPFEGHIAVVGTTSNNMFIKEKNSRWGFTVIKQVGDLAWSQIHLHSLCSYEPGYRALFQLTVCANSVGVCMHQMDKYLPHAYILKRTKSIKELYIQEHKKGKPTKEKVMIKHCTRLNGLTL